MQKKSAKLASQPKKLAATAVKKAVAPKKIDESSDSSDEESSSDDENVSIWSAILFCWYIHRVIDYDSQKNSAKLASQPKKLPATAAKNAVAPKKIDDSSDSSDEESSSDDEHVSIWCANVFFQLNSSFWVKYAASIM